MFNRSRDLVIDLDLFFDKLDRLNTNLESIRDELNQINNNLELKRKGRLS